MADMFAPLVAQLKANPKTIVFTEGNDPRILEAASKLLAEGVLKVVMVGNEAECKAAAAAGNFDISAAEIIDPENYAGFDEMVSTMVELRKGKQSAEECTALLKKSNYFGTMLVKMGKADCLLGGGSFLIIYLTVFAGVSQQAAQGINLVFFIPAAACAVLLHTRNRLVDWKSALPAMIAGAITAIISANIAMKIDGDISRKLFGAFVLIMGMKMLSEKPKSRDI